VLVIEHGGTDAGPFIQMPGALSYPMNMRRYDWGYRSEPEPHLGNRRLACCPRGKVIGGSSSINGMVYVRGHAGDYDHWRDSGAAGWGYADVLPYFKRMESWHDGGHGGDPGWRGRRPAACAARQPWQSAYPCLHRGGRAGGISAHPRLQRRTAGRLRPVRHDGAWKGRRWSAANAYLRPALKRANCGLVRGLVERVVIEEGRAVGVEAVVKGRREVIRARNEVILAASPSTRPSS
jgi:choline dehydrogenase